MGTFEGLAVREAETQAGRRFRWAFWLVLGLYFVLLGYDSVTRLRQFTPDSKYYIEIAQNVLAGNGIAHHTHDIDEARVLEDLRQPSPTTIWTPLYPFFIAAAHGAGIPAPTAALLLSALFAAILLVIVYRLARQTYGESLALLAVAYLAISGYLFRISTLAWSETTGIAFLALAFYFVVQDRSTPAGRIWFPVAAGVAACLAFWTRYAFLPMAGVVGLLLIERRDWRATLRNWVLFGAAYVLVALPLFVRNARLTDTIFGPDRPASDIGLPMNLLLVYTSASSWVFPSRILPFLVQFLLVTLAVLVLLGAFLASRRARTRIRAALRGAFLADKRYVFAAWAFGYLGYIAVYRSITHFDPLDVRLCSPGLIPLAVPVLAFLTGLYGMSDRGKRRLAVAFLGVGLVLVAGLLVTQPPITDYQKQIEASERFSWLMNETTARDLVFGDGLADITFVDPERTVVLTYVSTLKGFHVQADDFRKVVGRHCGRYDRTFLSLSKVRKPRRGWSENRGEFFGDLMDGRLEKYPDVKLVREFEDGYVFEVACPE